MRGTGWQISGIILVMTLGQVGAWAEDPTRPLPPEPEPAAVTEAAAAVEPVDDLQYAYGSVAEVAGDRLVVSEFDEVAGTMATQTYTISPGVELYDVDAVSEIAVGDEVDIDYVMKDGQRMAVAIAVGKFVEEDAEPVASATP